MDSKLLPEEGGHITDKEQLGFTGKRHLLIMNNNAHFEILYWVYSLCFDLF